MKAGDTFILPDDSADKHLWVVISDPDQDPEGILVVGLTSYDVTKEDVCLIKAREHPWVKQKTCVCYKPARQTSQDKLDHLRDTGNLRMHVPVSEEILRRIRRGVSLSRRIELEHVELREEQEWLD